MVQRRGTVTYSTTVAGASRPALRRYQLSGLTVHVCYTWKTWIRVLSYCRARALQ